MSTPFREADLYVHPLLRSSSLKDTKNLESPEGMGSVGAQLRGFGIHPNHCLSFETETPILL
jgi:hypothetical protein